MVKLRSHPCSTSPLAPMVHEESRQDVELIEKVAEDDCISSSAYSRGRNEEDSFSSAEGAKRMRTAIIASVVGNVLEWFDFGVFAFLAPQIGFLFFPKADKIAGLLNTFVVFAGGFVIRPLGGILLAHVGDVYGRKLALLLSVVGMAGSTFAMGCLPTYNDIGAAAPVLLCLLRLVQGLSVGGELVGSMVFAVESMQPGRQVLGGSFCLIGAIGGLTLGSAAGLVLHACFSEEELLRYAWRIPFWMGILIGLFAAWLRNGVEESSDFEELKKGDAQASLPVKEAFLHYPVEILLCVLAVTLWCAGVWLTIAFPPILYQDLLDPPMSVRESMGATHAGGAEASSGEGAVFQRKETSMWVLHTCLCAVQGVAILAGGLVGDYLGSTRTVLIGALASATLAIPCFKAMGAGRYVVSGLGQGVFNLALGFMGGSLPAWMVSIFPVQLRFSCIAVGYNAGQAIFGGTASIVGTMLFKSTGDTLAVGAYASCLALVSFFAVLVTARRERRKETRQDAPGEGGGEGECSQRQDTSCEGEEKVQV
uniref:Major facilitator superfamily (MFS) profile domain-containing protein n=1 Tax=Guillardia theta TaxID=55529 RepID=A0A6U6BG11_GUITH